MSPLNIRKMKNITLLSFKLVIFTSTRLGSINLHFVKQGSFFGVEKGEGAGAASFGVVPEEEEAEGGGGDGDPNGTNRPEDRVKSVENGRAEWGTVALV